MALITCEECNQEVSDNAEYCPHCGCPIDEEYKEDNSGRGLTLTIVSIIAFIVIIALYGNYTSMSKAEQDNVKNTIKYATNQPVTIYNKEVQLQEDQYLSIPFSLNKNYDITIKYEIISGPNIDVFFTNETNYNNWIDSNNDGSLYYHERLSTFDTSRSNRTERISKGEYVLVIDNSDFGKTYPPANLKDDISTVRMEIIKQK